MLPRDYNITPAIENPDVKIAGLQYERSPGLLRGDHIHNTGCICNTSASHTYGNALSVVEKYILDTFPHDTFATITVATSLRSRQLNHLPRQLRKKETPILLLAPRISFANNEGKFLENTLIASRYNDTHMLWGNGSLIPLAYSREHELYVHGHYNRALMYIDVIMTFDTYMEQLNWMSYIYNMFAIGHNQSIHAPLELYLPNNFCKVLSGLAKVPIEEKDGSVYSFLRMMNTIFDYSITYKLKGGTNKNSFFMYYLTDLDVVIQEPVPGPGIKDGQVRTNFDISFTIRCEFNTIGYLTINAPHLKYNIKLELDEKEIQDEKYVMPILSDQINLSDFKLPIGWTVLSWPIFKLDEGEDSISLAPLFNESLNTVIDYHLKTGISMDKFINIEFREHGERLSQEKYWIDWENRELHLLYPNTHRTYRLIISISPEYINNLVKEIYGLE